jgi:hypothetical protein
VQERIRHEILHIYTWAVGRQRLGGGGASGQGNMSGLVRSRYWLGKFVVGGVPLCYGINRAMRSAWWLVADQLRCTLHGCASVRTPPISQLPTAPPHLPLALGNRGQVKRRVHASPYNALFFCLCSLHISGLSELKLGDLEVVASPMGSP